MEQRDYWNTDVEIPVSVPIHRMSKKELRRKKRKIYIGRVILCLLTFVLLVLAALLGISATINYGPSESARDLFVMTVMETSAAKPLATLFFSDEEIQKITQANTYVAPKEITNTDLIEIPDASNTDEEFDINKIEVFDVTGATYKGKMMVVNDPSRVIVGTSGTYGSSYAGKTVQDMIIENGGIAGTNGGGFEDANGVGNGGTPLGIVIAGGQLKWGSTTKTYEVIGFDSNNKLVVGNMTGQEALDMGVRDAISFGPILIVNGEPTEVTGSGGGLNPRTAIGQRADGAVLLLVIDGRQANSLGANYGDLINVMTEYGAVNAANLDGGSSSLLVYNNEVISTCASLYGPRKMPTCIVVKDVQSDESEGGQVE